MITGTLMYGITRPKITTEDETIESSLVPAPGIASGGNRDKDSTKDNNNNTATANNEANGRSAALERAYVHDVYENCEEPAGGIRPKVAQFLSNLEPGSLVCDVGCGNGRYLTSGCNPSIHSIGVDRCCRLTKVARSSGAEVAICDNLELPFRDESFDAVLSLAVIHHFATTERRVSAIRELARVLRIGGRLIITVWALEQKSRRFESQDVLIPWQSPKSKNMIATSDDEDEDDFLPPYHAYTYTEDSNSSRSQGDGDSSSLSSSSPSDTCYSFVRRALQKLAGGKKSPWFLDSWNSKDTKNDSSLDYEDAKDLPIELRRLEDFDDIPEPLSSVGLKSRSLGSIINIKKENFNPSSKQIVRSRSSVPSLSLGSNDTKQSSQALHDVSSHSSVTSSVLLTNTGSVCGPSAATLSSCQVSSSATPSRRPKLIKQKQSITDDPEEFPFDEYKHLVHNDMRAQLLRKQSSLNEELMAESRIREKERIRKKIQKQMSLNETFLCRSLFSKRLQVIREGLTTKLKTSTGSLERVTKNGLVKIMQNIKSASNTGTTNDNNCGGGGSGASMSRNCEHNKTNKNGPISRKLSYERSCSVGNSASHNGSDEVEKMRRESGSDSSKDSSLQSDTSIESEDSFASVIYIPNKKSETLSNNKMPTVPTSPLTMIMPCPTPIHSPAPVTNGRQFSAAGESTRFSFDTPKIDKLEKSNRKNDQDSVVSIVSKKQSTAILQKSGMQTKISTIVTPPTPTALANSTASSAPSPMPKKATPPLSAKITRQTIKDLPPIPKFRKHSSFPIVRRITSSHSNIIVPKLMSLEIFNPETDDLDSDLDSSDGEEEDAGVEGEEEEEEEDPSSPDSIDSVINALQSTNSPTEPLLNNESAGTKQLVESSSTATSSSTIKTKNDQFISTVISSNSSTKQNTSNSSSSSVVAPLVEAAAVVANKLEDTVEMIIREQEVFGVTVSGSHQQQNHRDDDIDAATRNIIINENDFNLNVKITNHSNFNSNNNNNINNNNNNNNNNASDNLEKCREHLVDFAEKLSAQLLKELDNEEATAAAVGGEDNDEEENYDNEEEEEEETEEVEECTFEHDDVNYCGDPYVRKINGDIKNLSMLRDELRERRLLLANLGSKASNLSHDMDYAQQQPPAFSNTPPTTIQEIEEELDEDSPPLSAKIQSHLSQNSNLISSLGTPQSVKKQQQKINDFILEENEENEEDESSRADEDSSSRSRISFSLSYNACNNNCNSTHDTALLLQEDSFEENDNSSSLGLQQMKQNLLKTIKYPNKLNDSNNNSNTNSCDSWANSNTASLDSPSVSVGGSATHHVFHHVFREGELDSLINKHVNNLHIVSSYYERASWCVVCEKVQVWTI